MRVKVFGRGMLATAIKVEVQRRPGWKLTEAHSDIIFNAHGLASVDGCERDPAHACAANASFAYQVANEAKVMGSTLVHASTEYVFDGSPDVSHEASEPPSARSVYAITKLLGEKLAASHKPHHIVRLQSLYGENGRQFLSKLVALIRSGSMSPLATDALRRVRPMWVGTAARLLCDIATSGRYGIHHAVCQNDTTMTEFAHRLVKMTNLSSFPIYEVKSNRPNINLVPLYDAPTWQQSLNDYMEQRP